MQVLDAYVPPLQAGDTLEVTVSQTLDAQLLAASPAPITLVVDGPQVALGPGDLRACYPTPGSTDSAPNFLSYIALSRKSLPWERPGRAIKSNLQGAPTSTPWLALLVLTEAELHLSSGASPVTTKTVGDVENSAFAEWLKLVGIQNPGQQMSTMTLPADTVQHVLPNSNVVSLLCHVKKTRLNDTRFDEIAIVLANRLPDVGVNHAFLVSFERADSLLAAAPLELLVLYHWSFTTSGGGDFEEVIKRIRYEPNGGVLRFGNLAEPATHEPSGTAELSAGFAGAVDTGGFLIDGLQLGTGTAAFRGPLRPFPVPTGNRNSFAAREDPDEFSEAQSGESADYSYLAAFELGRVLAFSDSAVLDALQHVAENLIPPILNVPPAFNKLASPHDTPDQPWIANDGQPLVKNDAQLAAARTADPTGLRRQARGLLSDIQTHLSGVGPAAATTPPVDLSTVTSADLAARFADVAVAGSS
jgi:hypothetical protein